MRHLHGVVFAEPILLEQYKLKRQALLFDAINVVGLRHFLREIWGNGDLQDELDFLQSCGFLRAMPDDPTLNPYVATRVKTLHPRRQRLRDYYVRESASKLANSEFDVSPICQYALPASLPESPVSNERSPHLATPLQIGLQALPIPGDQSSWQDIFDSKKSYGTNDGVFGDSCTHSQQRAKLKPKSATISNGPSTNIARRCSFTKSKRRRALLTCSSSRRSKSSKTSLNSTGARLLKAYCRCGSERWNYSKPR